MLMKIMTDGCDNVVIVVAAGADDKIYLVSLG